MITITKVLEAANEFVKVLRFGRNDINTSEVALPYGIDSKPIRNKRGIVVGTQRKGRNVILGYLLKSDKTESGEIRHYATDDNGVEKFYIHLKKDGTCEIGGDVDNLVRYSKLEDAFNELKGKHNELINKLSSWIPSLTDGGTALKTILFTTPPIVTPSVADITQSKIVEIKSL